MASYNDDYLKFSAYSIKDLITRKLSQDTNFTDQIYEGSNLAILIDLFSYMAQCMLYSLNSAAAESMFSDTQIYENMSRLVKFLGYNPKGITPSTATFLIENADSKTTSNYGLVIPKYAYVDFKYTDSHGKKIYFSNTRTFTLENDPSYTFQMMNGKWKRYNQIFTATGDEFETFTLDGIGSKITDPYGAKSVANGMIDVYVQHFDSINNTSTWTQWEKSEFEIFTDNSTNILNFAKIYDKNKKIYSVRLNEDKQYEIKFGDGTIGSKLQKNDLIYIFYLDTNGYDGKLDIDDIDITDLKLKIPTADEYNLTEQAYAEIVGVNPTTQVEYVPVKLQPDFTIVKPEEDVQQIRENAPQWFKLGQRLVTESDYKYYIMNICGPSGVIDCAVQNNWTYMSTFYKWLYYLGNNGYFTNNLENSDVVRPKSGQYYINETRLIKNDYKYSDASDSNNIYIWTKMQNGKVDHLAELYLENIQRLKSATAEVVFLNPINVNFAITAAPPEIIQKYIKQNVFDELNESYIEITLDSNVIYTSAAIKTKIESTITDFFAPQNNLLGSQINYSTLLNNLYSITGIKRIRTVYQPLKTIVDNTTGSFSVVTDDSRSVIIRDGLNFATWSADFIDAGDDLDTSNMIKTLEPFQFPQLVTPRLIDKIKIIKKSITNTDQMFN